MVSKKYETVPKSGIFENIETVENIKTVVNCRTVEYNETVKNIKTVNYISLFILCFALNFERTD